MDSSPLNQLSGVLPTFGAPTLENIDVEALARGERAGGTKRQFVQFYNKREAEIVATDVKVILQRGSEHIVQSETPRKLEAIETVKEMVRVVTPGDKNEYDGEATDYHKREYWQQYKAFREGKGTPIGTPLEECTWIPHPVALEMKFRQCHTMEQLADASDVFVDNIANGWTLREHARVMCKVKMDSKQLAQVTALQTQLDTERKERERLQLEMQNLKAFFAQGLSPKADEMTVKSRPEVKRTIEVEPDPEPPKKRRRKKADTIEQVTE